MKNFIKLIKDKEEKISTSFTNKELKKLEHIMMQLKDQHLLIKKDISSINYLLDLIDKHQINEARLSSNNIAQNNFNNWVTDLTKTFEDFHLKQHDKLSPQDVEYLKIEKSKLLNEKKRLKEEQKHITALMAKTRIFLMDIRETRCNELSKGHTIADVGEKLLTHFGEEVPNEMDYDFGKRKIINFLEEAFLINKIDSKKLFDILEKSKAVNYIPEIPSIIRNSETVRFDDYIDYSYEPIGGAWHINS